MLKNLYFHYRYLFGSLWSDLRYRYAGTAIGFYWFIINPLVEVLIYTFVFSYLLGVRSSGRDSSYVLFLVTGLFPWLSFSQTIKEGTNSLVKNASYLRRMSIPTEVFIAKNVFLSFFSLLVYLLLLVTFFLFSGHSLGWSLLILPLLAFLIQLLALGITLTTGHLRILFPDIGEVLPTFLQLWRWILPIMYSYTIFPAFLQKALKFNPLYYYIESFRTVFLEQKFPNVNAWLHMLSWAIFFLIFGFFISSKLHSDVIDEI